MKDLVEEFFNQENSKYQMLIKLDTSGFRLVDAISKEIKQSYQKITEIKDHKLMFQGLVTFIEGIDSRILDINKEINSSRDLQMARVESIRDCYTYLVQKEEQLKKQEELRREIEESNKEQVKEIKKKIESGIDPEKERRKPGKRPEKIRNIRKAKEEVSKSKNSS